MRLAIIIAFAVSFKCASGWGRMNGAPPQTRLINGTNVTVRFTCAGAIRTPQIETNIRNQNPNINVALISRIPLQGGAILFFNGLHVYGVLVLAVCLVVQLALPKGTPWHMTRGRVVSFGIIPWFMPAAWVLNFIAIFKNVDDYWLAPALIDFRGQVRHASTSSAPTLQAECTLTSCAPCAVTSYRLVFTPSCALLWRSISIVSHGVASASTLLASTR